jgi:alpha-tubulin suppressor-like RCC1 family protein
MVGSVTVTPTSPSALVPGQTVALTATVLDEQGSPLTGKSVTWTSGGQATATVNSAGLVTAQGPGSTQITATVEGKSGSAAVTVDDGGFITSSGGSLSAASGAVTLQVPAQGVSAGTAIRVTPVPSPAAHPRLVPGTTFDVGEPATTIGGGGTLRLRYGTLPDGIAAGALRVHRWDGIAWQPLPGSVDAAAQTVSGDVGTLGRFALIGLVPIAEVLVSPLTLQLEPGATAQLSAEPRGPANEQLPGRAVEWASSNVAVASVSPTGLVTAVAIGEPVTITATAEGVVGTVVVTVMEEIAFVDFATSWDNSCALTSSGQAWCWGDNDDGELGTGSVSDLSTIPVAVATGLRFVEIAASQNATCGRTAAGAVWCWGDNEHGVLANAGVVQSLTPVQAQGGHTFTRLVAGPTHACGLTQAGSALCWGDNSDFQLGDGSAIFRATPTPVAGGHVFVDLALGSEHSCGITAAGAVWCWGENIDGALGDGTFVDRAAPVEVLGGHVFEDFASGEWHTCARKASGEAWCWGWNGRGQIGDGSLVNRNTPTKVSGADVWRSIHPSGWSTCGLLQSGLAKCWGENNEGTLGNGGTTDASTPTSVSGGHSFESLTTGVGYHFCGRRTDGVAMCWGWNLDGQVGVGDLTDRRVPTPVMMPTLGGLRAGMRAGVNEGVTRATSETERVPRMRTVPGNRHGSP